MNTANSPLEETPFFRCVAVMRLARPDKNAVPHIYFESLRRRHVLFLTSAFQRQVLPLFSPDGKAREGAEYAIVSVWQQKTAMSFEQAIKNWPDDQLPIPWYLFEQAFAAEDDLGNPILRSDGRRILALMGGKPQALNTNGTVDIGVPEDRVVRLQHNRLGARSIWDIGLEEDVMSSQPCPLETLFLTGG